MTGHKRSLFTTSTNVPNLKKLSTNELLEKQASLRDLYKSIQDKTLTLPDNGAKVLETLKCIEELLNIGDRDVENIELQLETLSISTTTEPTTMTQSPHSVQKANTHLNKKKTKIQVVELTELVQTKIEQFEAVKENRMKEIIDTLTKETLLFQQHQWYTLAQSMNWKWTLLEDDDSDDLDDFDISHSEEEKEDPL